MGQVQAARGTGVGVGRRQGRQGRPRRVEAGRGPADCRQCADRRRDRLHRAAVARPAADPPEGSEHQAGRLEPAGQPVCVPLQHDGETLRQRQGAAGGRPGAQPGGLPAGGHRRQAVLQDLQGAVRVRHAAASDKGMDGLIESNFAKSQALLKEAGYDGTPIVLLHSTDLAVLTNLAPVAKQLLEKGGFKVDMQDMDWQSVVARRAKKEPPSQGGWHAMLTSWVSADILNPVSTAFLNASCDKAPFGWPCDADMEKLRDDFARETDPAKQKPIAEAVQVRWTQYPTHVHLGQWYQPGASRKNVDGYVVAPASVFWNISKTGK